MQKNKGPRKNEQIKSNEVRLLDANGEYKGIVKLFQAISEAKQQNLDLVEIQANSNPPLCKIVDFGKFKYEQSKKEKIQRKNSKNFELKEIRLGKTINIDKHDLEIKLGQVRKFLEAGHPVLIVQKNLKKYEHKQMALERLNNIVKDFEEISKIQKNIELQGNYASVILGPKK